MGGLELLNKIEAKDFVIAELDSWQLQGFATEKISPDIAVFSNFFEDHLNYYPNMQKYFLDKYNIFVWQKDYDFLVTLPENITIFDKYIDIEKIPSKIELVFVDEFPKDWQVQFFGKHNFKNASLAKKTAELANLSAENIKTGLEKFTGIEGRMQFLGEKKGVLFFNDNNSTTTISTTVGLEALKEKYPKKKIFLVAGGTDKGCQYQELSEFIEKNIFYTLLFEASGTEKIVQNFSTDFQNYEIIDFMPDAQQKLSEKVREGDLVVLSPACSSFGKQFKNEYDRSDQFVELFKNF